MLKFDKGELELFWYWINERYRIYLNRQAGKPWPWTKDSVLQEYKFTNCFRQLDRVTQEWTKRYCRLLANKTTNEDILFWLCVFRFFNWPETYDAIYFGTPKWNMKRAIEILRKRKEEDFEQLYTGAYIITAGGSTRPKHEATCEALNHVFENKKALVKKIMKLHTMQDTVEIIKEIPTQGPFTSYEIACDLRHTRILHNATDVNTWANPGPGAKRGIHRLLTGSKEWESKKKPDYIAAMHELWCMHRKNLDKDVLKCEWPFEMREIEHSLCEYDKMRRVMNGEGRPRSRFHPKLDDDGKELKVQLDLPLENDDEE